ncbi:hypothetical protein GCM10008957_25430 [Deinococcus ruber]|uniref:Uncharacterized protein n=1 Tax=Deinococcus ruber TaxID=1848197 RepID=A0A918C8S1_9DEIO|nr:hypothetical protein GCM10008957_25430 [Deinococcus ruber]
MQSTVKVVCLTAVVLALVLTPGVPGQQAVSKQFVVQGVRVADDGAKPNAGGG